MSRDYDDTQSPPYSGVSSLPIISLLFRVENALARVWRARAHHTVETRLLSAVHLLPSHAMMAMLGRVSQWRFLLVFLIWCGSGEPQTVYLSVSVKPLYFLVNSSQLGPENCTATELLDKPQPSLEFLYVPTGTVCFECIIDGELATGAMFQIDNNEVSSSVGTVVNGTLVVFDTESTFPSQGNVRCSDESGLYGASVIHERKC